MARVAGHRGHSSVVCPGPDSVAADSWERPAGVTAANGRFIVQVNPNAWS